jgi:hypothetical protein
MTMPAPGVKIAGKLPQPDKNGLLAAAADLIDNPGQVRVVIAVISVDGSEENFKDQTITAKTSLARIEVIASPEDLKDAKRLLLRANQERNGGTVLPLNLEKDVESAFAAFVDDGMIPDPDND